MAKMFGDNRPLKQIKSAVKAKGWYWDQSKHDQGSDYVTFGFAYGQKSVTVVYNTFNGGFIVKDGANMVTHESSEMESTKWYDKLLNFIYLPKASKKAA